MIVVHNTGNEHQLRLVQQQTLDLIRDPSERLIAQEAERQRQRKWQMDRYGF